LIRIAAIAIAAFASAASAQPLVEQFDNVASLAASDWVPQNHSSPLGAVGWYQGSSLSFPPQASPGFIASDYRAVNLVGTISNWLVLPARTLNNGDALQFWTRTVFPSVYADRLQVRMSVAGPSFNVGIGPTAVGDFTTLLLDLNPTYTINSPLAYPTIWTQYTVTLSGLSGPTFGRLAFRYFVEHGGELGSNSDTIGIDTVEYTPGGVTQGRCCITATGTCIVTSPTGCMNSGGVFAGAGTTCDGFTCPQPPSGACCLASGTCAIMTSDACVSAGGLYRGTSTTCASAACPKVFVYAGGEIPIPDGVGSSQCGVMVSADLYVPLSFPIQSAEVAFIMEHRYQGDMTVRLTKVGGQSMLLVDRAGWPQLPYGFDADDFGSVNSSPHRHFRVGDSLAPAYDIPGVAAPGVNAVSGHWSSAQPLSIINGRDSAGLWRLELTDCAGGEYGALKTWSLILTPPTGTSPCYANCDESTLSPVLSANDFQCFLNLFAAGNSRANCDGSLQNPMLTANDFGCFLNQFVNGCP